MNRDKLVLSYKDCEVIAGALWQYNAPDVASEDFINELRLNVESEGVRIQQVEKRKAKGLFIYVFYDKNGKEIDDAELHNNGEAWEYVYKVLAPYYPVGVTFERIED